MKPLSRINFKIIFLQNSDFLNYLLEIFLKFTNFPIKIILIKKTKLILKFSPLYNRFTFLNLEFNE